jgi:quinol monooxygenase YgiN
VPLVSITRLRVRSWRYLPFFFVRALQSARQAASAEGNLSVRLLRDSANTFWTATVWTSEASMKAFMISGVHGRVMRKLLEWCDEAALVHWTQKNVESPAWADAYAHLRTEGRRSKVNYPSPAHTSFEFPGPVITRSREVHIK